MQIRIDGTSKFISLIQKFHNEFKNKILKKSPKYSKLESIVFQVVQTSKLDVAGRASFANSRISINACLTHNNPSRLYEIYGHELAHCYSTLFHNKNINHGKEWVEVMRLIDLKPTTELTLNPSEISFMDSHLASCNCLVNNQKIIHRKEVKSFSVCNMCYSKYIIR